MGSAQEVVRRAVYMCGVQLAREPLLRATLRDALRDRATLTVKPTQRGLKEIDENHACFGYVTVTCVVSRKTWNHALYF